MSSRGDWVVSRPLWMRWPWNAVFGALALVLVAGGITWVAWPADTSCAPGVRRVGVDGACVGVSDGSYHFNDGLARVANLIRQENDAVVGDGRTYVSIIYLMPLDPGPHDTYTPDSVRHEVQGAYAAQWQANHTGTYGDVPRIKLLLANTGSTDEQRDAALEEIRGRIEPDHVVAVAGLGTSTDATERMVRKVTAKRAEGGLQLGAVGSVLTADTLSRIQGLVRVAPTNSDEAATAASFLKRPAYARLKVLVLQDVRADDQYTQTLSQAFLRTLPQERLAKTETYDSSQEGVATAFKTRMANLCAAEPDVIYFAGRGVDLPHFLAPLKDRPCPQRKLIVFSGDDASQAAQATGFDEIKETLRSGSVRLLYTGLAHPGAWAERPAAYPGSAVSAFAAKGRFRTVFPQESLDDGQAIMAFDAVLTAVSGARMAGQSANGRVTGSEMIQIWNSLHGVDAVKGASGLISLDNDGSPENKAVPVIEIRPDGSVRTLGVSSPDDTPLT